MTSLQDLDALYGKAQLPKTVRKHETRKQSTWLEVNPAGAKLLNAFIVQAVQGAYVVQYLNQDFTTLWLIAEDGSIRVAIEEFVLEEGSELVRTPMPRGYRTDEKLGHPSLVEGGPGRIGGELSVNIKDGKCYLTNQSGRFGMTRTPAELENAAEAFRRLGVPVIASFVKQTW